MFRRRIQPGTILRIRPGGTGAVSVRSFPTHRDDPGHAAPATSDPSPSLDPSPMLPTRLATSLFLSALFILLLVVDTRFSPWFPLWLAATLLITGMAAREITALLSRTSARPLGGVVVGGVLIVIASNWVPHVTVHLLEIEEHARGVASIEALAWPLCSFVAVVLMSFIVQSARFEHPGDTMATISGTVLAVSYVGLLGSFIVQFRWLEGPHRGLLLLVALIATAKGADTGAYTLGRLAGRRKLWPRLSPNKTVEGALGGLIFGLSASVIVFGAARLLPDAPRMPWLTVLGFGLVVGSAAQLGDLMESMIKRDCERKDASTSVPGFGGVLDVLDSLLFAAPIAYGYWLVAGL